MFCNVTFITSIFQDIERVEEETADDLAGYNLPRGLEQSLSLVKEGDEVDSAISSLNNTDISSASVSVVIDDNETVKKDIKMWIMLQVSR